MLEEKWGGYAVHYGIKLMPSPIHCFELLVSGGPDLYGTYVHDKAADDLGKSLKQE